MTKKTTLTSWRMRIVGSVAILMGLYALATIPEKQPEWDFAAAAKEASAPRTTDTEIFADLFKINCRLQVQYHATGKLKPNAEAVANSTPDDACAITCYETNKTMFTFREIIAHYSYTPNKVDTKGAHYTICADMKGDWTEWQKSVLAQASDHSWAKDYKPGKNCFKRTIPPCTQRMPNR